MNNYFTIQKSKELFTKYTISFPATLHYIFKSVKIGNKEYLLKPNTLFNSYFIVNYSPVKRGKSNKTYFIDSKNNSYSIDSLIEEAFLIFKNGKLDFGASFSKYGVVNTYFFNETFPEINNFLNNEYLKKIRNYTWLFEVLQRNELNNIIMEKYPEYFLKTKYIFPVNIYLVSKEVLLKLLNINEMASNIATLNGYKQQYEAEFLKLKEEYENIIKNKPEIVKDFIDRNCLYLF